jgi:hypothetical protein
LTAVLTKTGTTTATLSLTGQATAHASTNDIANLTVSLSDATFTLGNAAGVTGALKDDLVVDFIDWAVIDLTPTIIHIQHPSGCIDIHDPSNNEHGCEIISGSILTYQIDLPVTGNIDGLVLTNPIPADMTYVAESIFVDGVAKTDATDGDKAEFSNNTIIVTAGIITGTTIFSFTFRTIIN